MSHSFASTFAGGEPTFGNMFDIKAARSISIKEMDLHINNIGSTEIEIYHTCCGLTTHSIVKRHPTAWRLAGSKKVNGNGAEMLTPLPSDAFEPICIDSGLSKGFYITATEGKFLEHSHDGVTGDVYKSNDDLSMIIGVGKRYFLLNDQYDRIANFSMRYSILEEEKSGTSYTSLSTFSGSPTSTTSTHSREGKFVVVLSLFWAWLCMTTVN